MEKNSVNKAIRNAIKRGNINSVKELIGKDKKILHTMTPFGSWLHIAAKKGQMEIVEYLVHKGINVNIKGDIFDASPLRVAAGEGHVEIVQYLIQSGAELDVSLAKRNPLFSAIYGGHKEIVEYLVNQGIDISVQYTGENIEDMDAYRYAKEFGQTEIADYLKQKLNEKVQKRVLED
ncbi:ankyrin repeat domain-containing protein [Priestia megaterium]|uniref:ankyrin repeat domain-containing protein n=1 Tax=Priestia megaterium TaxID=1404 RepID=UPI001E33436A|nr:ankyrin repeat domain-containing protein [Priestia megaterium]MCE4091948.1 ankyrin repeat domain-containing protein [Priestia megaterium]